VDALGNSVVTGRTLGDWDGLGAAGRNVFAMKVDSSGALDWIHQYPGETAVGRRIAASPAGDLYLLVHAASSIDGYGVEYGSKDAILMKLDSSGTRL
jgi:hypothetical protein